MANAYIDINERMKHNHVAGLSMSVIHRGHIVQVDHYGLLEIGTNKKVDSNAIFNACSISKFLTAFLVMRLTEQGMLDLDEDVNHRLTSWKIPDNPFTANKKVTLRSLLSHQSGIVDPPDSFGAIDSNEEIPSMVNLLSGRTSYCKEPIEVKYEPESDFQYSDAGFCLIQQLIEDVIGEPFERVMEKLIFRPLKMMNSTYTPIKLGENIACGHTKDGSLVDRKYPIYPYPAAAGLWTTSSDLALLVIDVMSALKKESKVGISANQVNEMITPQGCKEWTGLGVFLDGEEVSSLGWGVGFQCMLVAYPRLGSGLIIMTNTDQGVHQLEGIIGEVYHSHSFE
ncbi:penicillin-binding protein [Bacillus sp. FJAT-27916]|uniref:serine hydrolase domain-containing protein n=1 Tax=Bacillus sp. FJAT-27916 TaxID=1679169 RepID=UPI0006710BD4|nr:serine hydrolase domain-containing protein [Bacillus sp. FJAT-27916]KMY44761.1 penicillin-binding protein [Bacillus sp. FJAT-27916]